MKYTQEMMDKIRREIQITINELNGEFDINLHIKSFKGSIERFSLNVLSETPELRLEKRTEAREQERLDLVEYLLENGISRIYLYTPIHHPTEGIIEITGFKSRATKNPIILTVDGESSVCGYGYIKAALRAVEKAKAKEQEEDDNLDFL